MSDADFRAAYHLLERTIALLDSPAGTTPDHQQRAARCLLLEIDLLRARIGQPPVDSQRN